MKLKSILLTTIATACLAGCTSTQLRVVDGKEREVFVSTVGTYSKDGATKEAFLEVHKACFYAAVKDSEGKHLDRFIPYNYPARARYNDGLIEHAEPCIQAAGYELVERSKTHSSMPGKS